MESGKRNIKLFNVRRKNRRKLIRTAIQIVMLLGLGFLIVQINFKVSPYVEPNKTNWANERGFIALSYFGVDRVGSPKHIAKKQLNEQLEALHEQGYVTITQQDIINFYQKGTPLPEKALFLSFEDGRNDSRIYAEPLLKKYNFKATFLSYANKFGNSQRKFVQPKEMLRMAKSGYWELGSNGYRLTYINIFDPEGRYIGVKDESELPDKTEIEYYNHYLMDFIRDEHMIPLEDRAEMEARIKKDYALMKEIYDEKLGFVPQLYMIMHANSLHSGMNRLVENVNSAQIESIFKLHFNREGVAFNSREGNLFDLTRVQPAPYWSTNHLLMKLQEDTGNRMEFVQGNEAIAAKWEQVSGAVQFTDQQIILTSPSENIGMLYLKESEKLKDIRLKTKLTGNVVGRQAIYVRYNRQHDSFVRVVLENNELRVEQKPSDQAVNTILVYPLDEIVWKNTDIAFDKATIYRMEHIESESVSDAAYPMNIRHTRNIEIDLQASKLNIKVDKKDVLTNWEVDSTIDQGGVALASQAHELNKKDRIYDGIFEELEMISYEKSEGQAVVYSDQKTRIQKVAQQLKRSVNTVINWFIDTF